MKNEKKTMFQDKKKGKKMELKSLCKLFLFFYLIFFGKFDVVGFVMEID
jgi:hypothetical protein